MIHPDRGVLTFILAVLWLMPGAIAAEEANNDLDDLVVFIGGGAAKTDDAAHPAPDSGKELLADLIVVETKSSNDAGRTDAPRNAPAEDRKPDASVAGLTVLADLDELVVFDSDPEPVSHEAHAAQAVSDDSADLIVLASPPRQLEAEHPNGMTARINLPAALPDDLQDIVPVAKSAEPPPLPDIGPTERRVPRSETSLAAAPDGDPLSQAESAPPAVAEPDLTDDLVFIPEEPAAPVPAAIESVPPLKPSAFLLFEPGEEAKGYDRVEELCLGEETDRARDIYDSLPDFGDDPELNRLRSDAANLLILGYGQEGKLDAAREIFDAVPAFVSGGESLGRARAMMNLTTFYIRANMLDEGYDIFSSLMEMPPNPETDPELFRLAGRMIPYLDNVGMTDEANAVFDFIARLADLPDNARLYRACVPGLTKYLLGRPSIVESTPEQERRLALMIRVFERLKTLDDSPQTVRLSVVTAEKLHEFHTITGNIRGAQEMRDYIVSAEGGTGKKR